MIKILIIIPSLKTDGVTNSTISYLENMDRTDLDICVGVASKEGNLQLQIDRIKALNIPIIFLPTRHKETRKYCEKLKQYLDENPRDIIHVMGNSATMAIEMTVAKRCGVPVRISHVRSTSCKYKILNYILKPILYINGTDYFSCGKEAGQSLYGDRKFTIIPNGKVIDRYLFNVEDRNKLRKEFNADEKIVLGHTGMFIKAKNHKFLIEVFKRLCEKTNNYELWLIGNGGELESEVHEMVSRYDLNDKVRFLGYRTDVEKILSAIDIAVFPSLYEGLPNVVIEWQIAGLPCLLSDAITDECKVMDNVKFLPLKSGVEKWCSEIGKIQLKDRNDGQEFIIRKMSEMGYDIKSGAAMLKNKYTELYRGKKHEKKY